MSSRTAITVDRPREEIERLWSGDLQPAFAGDEHASVRFTDAPGDRGTEIHVELAGRGLAGGRLAKVRDELRHFKARVETGEIARSDGVPEGERAERKLRQRPAQPLSDAELPKAGAR